MKAKNANRLLALLLCLCMVAGTLPLTGMAFAAESCPNHPAHDAACGYVEAVEGHACGHTHDEACGYAEAGEGTTCKHEQGAHDENCGYREGADEIPCDKECAETGEDGAIVHAEGCAYVPAIEAVDCSHTLHDENCGFAEPAEGADCRHAHEESCGFAEAVEGRPCGHACESCGEAMADTAILLSARGVSDTFTVNGVNYQVTKEDAPGGAGSAGQNTVAVTGGSPDANGKLTIPATVSDNPASIGTVYEVTGIQNKAFQWASGITKLELPQSGSLSIGASAFEGTGLSGTLTIPSSVTSIGDYAFYNLSGITKLELPGSGSLSIGESAFQGTGLSGTLIIPASVTTIGVSAFRDTGLSGTLTIPASVTSIGDNAFYGLSGITKLELPQSGSLTIGVSAFRGTGLSGALTIPASVTSIGRYAFYGLSGITKLELPLSGSLSIGASAFQETGLSGTLTIPSSVTSIGEQAFHKVGGITKLELPQSGSLTTIGPSAFEFTGLSGTLTIPSSVATIGKGAFYNLSGITRLELPQSGSLSIGESAFSGTSLSGTLTIPAGVTSIGERAFGNCSNLTAADFSSYTGSLGRFVLEECPNLSSLTFLQNPAPSFDRDAFYYLPSSGTGYYPAGAAGYTAGGFAGGRLSGWTFTSIPARVPSAPSIAQVTPDRESISFTWSAAANGGSDILRYEYSVSAGADNWVTAAAGQFSATVAVPQSATVYTIKVRAVNGAGAGAAAIWRVSPVTDPPTAPQNLGVTAGKGQLVLDWDAPASDGGSPILKYQYSVSTIDEANWKDVPDSNASTKQHTLTGLEGKTTYYVKLRAVNAAGVGAAAQKEITTLPKAPSAPRELTASSDHGRKITLTWKAPQSDGGEEIIRYEYMYYAAGSSAVVKWLPIPESNASTTSYTFSGLEARKDYVFTLRAVNMLGGGGESTVTAQTHASGPSKPQNFTAVPGDGQFTYIWDPPENDGGLPLTYWYTYTDIQNSYQPPLQQIPGSNSDTTSFTLTGLENGCEYMLILRVANAVGSEIIFHWAVLATVPTAPQNFQAVPGDGQVALTWEAPQSNGHAAITGYEVSKDNGSTWEAASTHSGHTFAELENGAEYTFKARAVNRMGNGAEATVTATPQATVTVPTAPLNIAASPGDEQVSLTWEAPQSNGGAAITKYQVSATTGGTENWQDIPDSGPDTTGHTVTGLTNGTLYTFKVRAVNSAGTGMAASTTATPASQAATYTLSVASGTDVTNTGPYTAGAQVTIRANAPADGKLFKEWTSSGGGSFLSAASAETTFTMPAQNVTVTATYEADRAAPTGEIKVKENGWTKFWNTITFNLFFKETQDVTITASDNSGQDVAIAWYKATTALSLAQVQALEEGAWTAYTGTFSVAPDDKLVLYARLTDKAGNVAYLSSQGIVLDATAPVIAGVQDGQTYTESKTVTVSDSYLESVTLNGDIQTVAEGSCTIRLETNGVYTIAAADEAGNMASVTVTIDIAPPTPGQVATPVFNPAGGTYQGAQSVTITCGTEGADIYYTTDGSAPTAGSTKYTEAIPVATTTTLKAIAVKEGMTNSAVAQAIYTIESAPTHSHSWAAAWTNDGGHHWHECTADGCPITANSEKNGYAVHRESEWITTKPATETEAGSRKKECTVCKRALTVEEIPATGAAHTHTLTHTAAKAATCVEDGHIEYWTCAGCGKYFRDSKGNSEIELSATVTPATGEHTAAGEWQKDDAGHWKLCSVCNQEVGKAAHSGGTANCHAKAVCEVCGVKYGKLNPKNHDGDTEVRDQKEATETEDGYTGDTYCKGCNKIISTGTAIPATGHTHSYTGGWQSDGKGHWKLCAVCGKPGDKTPHSGGTANCHAKAACQVCGAKYGKLNPTNHDGDTEIRDRKEATETEDGYTGDAYCKGCNKIIITGTIIPATGTDHTHAFGGEWQRDTTHHWQLCTAGDGAVGNKAAHTPGGWIDDEPLSENELSRKHQECTVCGYTLAISIIIKTEGVVEVKPDKDSNWTFFGTFDALKALKLNGVVMGIVPLSGTSANLTYPDYEGVAGIAKAGSVEVTLYADFLKTLPAGTYTLEAEFEDGETTSVGSTEFTVVNDKKPEPTPDPDDPKPTPKPENPSDVPATGDNNTTGLLLALTVLSGSSLLAIYGVSRKRKRAGRHHRES